MALHGGVEHFFAHRLFDCAHGCVPRPIANSFLELRVENTDREAMTALHLLDGVFKLLFKPVKHTNKIIQTLDVGKCSSWYKKRLLGS